MDSDPQENITKFIQDLKQQANPSAGNEGNISNSATTRTRVDPDDGTEYEWDSVKQGWFPKVDEDFIAAYQMSYGFTSSDGQDKQEGDSSISTSDTTTTEAHTGQPVAGKTGDDGETQAEEKGKKRKIKEEGWFEMDPGKNPNVYVSGLPLNITDEEFVEMMSKYGIIMDDTENQNPKIKLYRDEKGKPKGDGRCCYLKIESVNLVISLLDESEYRGSTLHVEQAKFHMTGDYNPSLKKKKKKKKKKTGKGQEKLLDWVDRDERRPKQERIVVIRNMFDAKEFEKNPRLILELRNDLRTECEKFGDVRKVIVFDRNSEGVCSIAFREHPPADTCLQVMDGRWFAGRRLKATKWDGVSNFKIEESEKDVKDRMQNWEDFLFGEEDEKAAPSSTSTKTEASQSTGT